jgi:hypothetical protein
MGKKLLVSLAMEGKFSAEGLQALEDDDDMLTAMARELVTQEGVGEKADEVWKRLQAERARTLCTELPCRPERKSSLIVTPESDVEAAPPVVIVPPAAPGLAEFGAGTRRSARRPAVYSDENQLSFGF